MEFFATCPAGLEAALAAELVTLGVKPRPLKGRVSFEAELEAALRAALVCSCASRVMLVLRRGTAKNSDELYESVRAINWEDYLEPTSSISIDAHGTNRELRSENFVALRAKDAIADRILESSGVRLESRAQNAELSLFVHLSGERVTAGIVVSGSSPLFTFARGDCRGLRSDYAAALLGDTRDKRTEQVAILFSGAGTLLEQSTAQLSDEFEELERRAAALSNWKQLSPELRERALVSARDILEVRAEKRMQLSLIESRRELHERAFKNLRARGIDPQNILFASVEELNAEVDALICDLSWTKEDPSALASATQELFCVLEKLTPKRLCLLMPAELEPALATATEKSLVLMGKHELLLATYDSPAQLLDALYPLEYKDKRLYCLDKGVDQFVARLEKVAKLRRKWAAREAIGAYRVYDADLADFSFAIELYRSDTSGKSLVLVSEYAPPKNVDATRALKRRLDACTVLTKTDILPTHELVFKTRMNSKGGSQYADDSREYKLRERFILQEGGLDFELNFHARHDVGIFLDMRDVRSWIREQVKSYGEGACFLNLFCYTATASVYAADARAKTSNVDLSKTSLEIARRNMELNGFDASEHEFIQADVLKWVQEKRHSSKRWDLIFCDVPSFSNSSRMRKRGFDVQRDHAELIIGVSRLLKDGGLCIFSCNLRNFKIDAEALERAGVRLKDVSEKSVPEDFKRRPNIHHCYLITRAN